MRGTRRIAPILVIAIGLLILLYPTISNYTVMRNASRAVSAYDAAVDGLTDEQYERMLQQARDYNMRLLHDNDGITFAGVGGEGDTGDENGGDEYNSLLDVDGTGMMGYIVLPRLNETLPIRHGTSEPVLQSGAGHLASTSLPVGGIGTHASLSGHTGLPSAKLFTGLDDMIVGDLFYLRILKETLAYKVTSIETVLPSETGSLAIRADRDMVTLITCTPYGVNTHRLLVHAERTDYTPDEDELDTDGGWYDIPLPYLLLAGATILLIPTIIGMRHARNRRRNIQGRHRK